MLRLHPGLKHAIDRLEAAQAPFQRDLCANLLRECCRLRALNEGRRLHALIARAGQTQDNLLVNSLIQLYGYHGCLHESQSLFQSLRNRNVFSWNMIISAYIHSGHLYESQKLFHSMGERNVFSWNLLISAFIRGGDTTTAEKLFNKMPQRSVVSCNTILAAYARSGHISHIHELFLAMLERSIVSWNTILDIHITLGEVATAKLVFERLPSWDVVSCTTMLAGFAQTGDLGTAWALFKRIPEPNVVSWNALLEAHAASGDLCGARRIFDVMPVRSIVSWNEILQPSAVLGGDLGLMREIFGRIPQHSIVSWNIFLHACAANCRCQSEYEEFKTIAAAVPEEDVVTSTLAIAAAAKAWNLEDAEGIFHSMTSPKNLVCWNCMLQVYAETGHLQESEELFDKMPGHDTFSWNTMESRRIFDLTPMTNLCSWNGMMTGYIASLDLDSARAIFDASPDRPLCLWAAMILAYAQDGRSKHAIQLFRLMDLEGTEPDPETLAAILDACAVVSDLQVGKIVVEYLGGGGGVDLVLGGAIVNMYAKCGCVGDAERSFLAMPTRNLIAWNTMIAAYAHSGRIASCLASFQSMLLDGIDPDGVSFLTILSACSHAGALQSAIEIFLSSAQDHGLSPTAWHYCCVIDLLGRAGKLGDAEDLIRGMPFKSDEGALWQSFLSSCRSHGDAQRGTLAARRAAALEPRESSSYVTLAGVLDGS
ncbi:pentatricopeptide repeat-containing protein At4g02750-like [Selaginella moellendorffii]|uniref:pentatricopeptide repeat-containing protein At4g02750-like n=1 Tax=Selaginella moellendorffii TaxID=88036 RepID=UPI000D1C564E|nr:pentatricopeptide repeat-containing protein At4g02750-like [Selaginella moellendorffii]|eukprot:XP_024518944.1 pentatricopeptide repeat-containing protein At4g02750-like [Selaginella moellendorffii]